MSWDTLVVQRLQQRDRLEQTGFATLFDSYNRLNDEFFQLQSHNAELQQQSETYKAQFEEATRVAESLKELGSPEAQKRQAGLEAELSALKVEQAELYRTQGQNAQRLLEVMEANKSHEVHIKKQAEEIQLITASRNTLATKLRDANELMKEKDGVIQILRDELSTHQLELVQREQQLNEAEAKLKKLEAEHTQLVERWLHLKAEEAAKINQANEILESALRTKQAEETRRQTSRDSQIESPRPSPRSAPPNVLLKRLSAHDGDINCIQISRDGSLVATGGNDKKLMLHDARTGTTKATLIGSLQAVVSASFSADSEMVLGTSNDNSVKIWGVATSRMRHTLTGHIGKVFSAKFTDSNKVISGSHDRTIKLWDLAKGYCVQTIFTLSSCNDLDLLDGEGSMIVSGHLDNNLRLWDTKSGNLVREVTGIHSAQITSVNISPSELGSAAHRFILPFASDGNCLLTTSRDNSLKLVDIRTYGTLSNFTLDNFRVGMNWSKSCFSPDGFYVAAGSIDGSVVIWNAETAAVERVLREHRSAVCGVTWGSKAAGAVYSAEKDRSFIMWGGALK
ncbi:WD40-repeat-containing domain protein [Zopfochytrium polystomum]|nr:WD40-repeat-containing domain protein [Zopfochytrium polystomum]